MTAAITIAVRETTPEKLLQNLERDTLVSRWPRKILFFFKIIKKNHVILFSLFPNRKTYSTSIFQNEQIPFFKAKHSFFSNTFLCCYSKRVKLRRIQNPVKHLKRCVLRKHLSAFSRKLFSQKYPSGIKVSYETSTRIKSIKGSQTKTKLSRLFSSFLPLSKRWPGDVLYKRHS